MTAGTGDGRSQGHTSRTFEAKYPGSCDSCDEPIKVGDWVRYDDCLVHAECPGPPSPAVIVVCPQCWCTHAGECA